MPGIMDSLTTIFQNPDFLQMLAGTGAGLSKGQGLGEALGGSVSGALSNIAGRNAYQDMIRELRGDSLYGDSIPTTETAPVSQLGGLDGGLVLGGQPLPEWLQKDITTGITPKGSPGLDAYNVQHTADGSTITMKSSSPQNRNTYGTNVPTESIPTTLTRPTATAKPAGGRDFEGFFQALLGQDLT